VAAASRFSKFAWLTLGFNVLVILWGAIVRLTGSGAGCGSHWPDCNGQLLPLQGSAKTLVEFTHRSTSGLALLLVVALVVWSFRAFAKGHPVRKSSSASLIFILISALVGAWIVKANLVEGDKSVARAVTLSLHFVNTMMLLASLTLTARLGAAERSGGLRGSGMVGVAIVVGALLAIAAGSSGAITALGDTLFPPTSSVDVIQSGLSGTAHFLQRLRILHPILALAAGFYLLFLSALLSDLRPDGAVRSRFKWVVGLVVAQIALGIANVFLKAPMSLAILHLLVADLIWVAFVLAAASALAVKQADAKGDLAAIS
jgi:heme A synthase